MAERPKRTLEEVQEDAENLKLLPENLLRLGKLLKPLFEDSENSDEEKKDDKDK